MNPFSSPTGEARPDMVLLLGVLLIALSLGGARIRAAARALARGAGRRRR
jgi:hypothetical protein